MISQQRLDQIVTEALGRGWDAHRIATATGIPKERIQATIHRLNGRDPATRNAKTQATHARRRRNDPRSRP